MSNAAFFALTALLIVVIAALAVFPVYYLVHIARAPNWGVALYIFIWSSLGTSSAARR